MFGRRFLPADRLLLLHLPLVDVVAVCDEVSVLALDQFIPVMLFERVESLDIIDY